MPRSLDILQPLDIHRGNGTQFPGFHNMQLHLLCRQFLFLLQVLSFGILQIFHILQEIETHFPDFHNRRPLLFCCQVVLVLQVRYLDIL